MKLFDFRRLGVHLTASFTGDSVRLTPVLGSAATIHVMWAAAVLQVRG